MSRGFLYAATGALYVTLARRSARALRLVHPDAEIDLFSDMTLDDPVFNRVVGLDRPSRRPKVEALQRSRFDRTIYLDADTALVAPIDDVFDLLNHVDIALCSELRRNDPRNRVQLPGLEVPPCWPQLNTGLIALRKSAAAQDFLNDWDDWVHNRNQQFDQPALRALLLRTSLRAHVLPPEYNVMFFGPFMHAKDGLSAPRLIHQPRLHNNPPGDPMLPLEVKDLLPPEHLARLALLLSQDQTLARHIDVLAGRPGTLLSPGKNPNPKAPIGADITPVTRSRLARFVRPYLSGRLVRLLEAAMKPPAR